MPVRVQMRRDRPWRKDHPEAVIVARPTKWGNPWKIGINRCSGEGWDYREEKVSDATMAVRFFRDLLAAPRATLPEPPPAKDRWLTRPEAAWLLRAARALNKDGQHLTRFILVGLYTGTRKGATLALHLEGPCTDNGWTDLDRGILYRKGLRQKQTKKRQTPARIPPALLSNLRRWHARGDRYVVQTDKGRRVSDIKKGWNRAKALAGVMAAEHGIAIDLSDCTPHVLRHTCATWAMQGGADKWGTAGFLGMSVETLDGTYGHHHPDFQSSAVQAISFGRAQKG